MAKDLLLWLQHNLYQHNLRSQRWICQERSFWRTTRCQIICLTRYVFAPTDQLHVWWQINFSRTLSNILIEAVSVSVFLIVSLISMFIKDHVILGYFLRVGHLSRIFTFAFCMKHNGYEKRTIKIKEIFVLWWGRPMSYRVLYMVREK